MRNQVHVVEKLIQSKADVNEAVCEKSIFWSGYTPLHFAVKFQCTATVEFLLKIGVGITIKDARELTPLHYADMVRNQPIIDMILKAQVSISTNPANSEGGLSHFYKACITNKFNVVVKFIEYGVDVNTPVSLDSNF
ncbi:hypothetical protein QAD02_011450 [Eretmocerus hayati]|uniref:Uncharacterized protein n=1 Tax=Eretmocerus hayati TaxID=131215 RepID=A0ACC2NZF2_9HYME|nr:hypothetical protein QAD02_011450 [Eretmocerus hayati]